MVKRKRINDDNVGIVNEARIHTDSGLVTITNSHLGEAVYEVKIVSEGEVVIEEFGEMSRGRAWGMYDEKCRYYDRGTEPISEGSSIISGDLEDGLPGSLLGRLDY